MSSVRSIVVPFILLLAAAPNVACVQGTPAGTAASPQSALCSRVADLGSMAGCWRDITRSGTAIEEFYTTAVESDHRNDALRARWPVVDFEFTRIDQTDSGAVITPHPKGVRSVSFAPKIVEANRAVWENAAHDFPQRILCTRVATDTLVARIEGRTPSGERALEWRMTRADCGLRTADSNPR